MNRILDSTRLPVVDEATSLFESASAGTRGLVHYQGRHQLGMLSDNVARFSEPKASAGFSSDLGIRFEDKSKMLL